jgi:hypothetical protein
MEALFAEGPEYITGPNNRFLLDSILTVDFPAIDQVDENDDNWVVQRLYGSEQQLANDGKIKHGSWWSSAFGGLNLQLIKIKRPNTEGVERINTDPQVIMDLFLQNVRHDFTLTYGYDYRILSLGEPRSTGEFRDAQGRTWITAFWMVNHSEKMYLAYILPQPGGPVVLISEPDIFSRSDGGDLHIFDWDIRKVCDHLHIPYSGTFEEWNEFLKLSRYVPDFLKEFKFDWQDDTRRITFALPDFSVSLGPQVFDWTDASYLFIAPAYYRQNGVVQFGVNHVRIDRDFIGNDYNDDYISIRKKLKPDERMDRAAKKEWQDVVSKKAPYNEKPVINADNYGRIRTVFNVKPPADDVCYTLLLGKENTADQDITERFAMLKSGISFAEYAKARAVRPLYGTGIFRYTAL